MAEIEGLSSLAIVGAGRVGGAVAKAAEAAGIKAFVLGRDDADEVVSGTRVALLCVPDEQLSAACERISAAVPPLELVGHTSGASTLDVLAPSQARGADVFSIHPLQTIPDSGSRLAGAPCAISGSSTRAEELAEALATRLEMVPFTIPESARATYHAAASMSSNLLVALEESAADLLELAGVENARELLAPIVARTAANWGERGAEALTGPIARGDEETVRRHRETIAAVAPELAPTYDALAERARVIADRNSAPR